MVSAGPTVRSFSAEFEPLRLVERFPDAYPGLLESSAPLAARGEGGRFDILPIASEECLELRSPTGAAPRLTGPHADGSRGFLAALEAWCAALRLPASPSSLPFSGGWLLYLGYELAAEIEPRLVLPPSDDSIVALAIRTPAAWIRDRVSGEAWLVAEPGAESLLERFEGHVERLRREADTTSTASREEAVFDVVEDPPAHFTAAVEKALEHIAAGDVYQANLSRQWRVVSGRPLDPVAVYAGLRTANPSPFAALLRRGGFSVMSSSPERLLSIRDGVLATRPIAGTRPRGATAAQDAALVASLLDNDKERAEHVMLIDLERNDLGRVCLAGSVHVDEYMTVETYAHVHHIVSNRQRPGARRRFTHRGDPCAVSRRHHHGLSQGAMHGNHRGVGGNRPWRLHRVDRLLEPRRQLRSQHSDTHADRRGRRADLSGRRGHRRGFDTAAGTCGNPGEGQGPVARPGRDVVTRAPASRRAPTRWVNGRPTSRMDVRDRGLQYGDGLFETMRVRRGRIRLLEYHLERLAEGCRRLGIAAPDGARLRRELERAAAPRRDAVLKLIVTRGVGPRGYRASGRERTTRLLSLHALSRASLEATRGGVGVRLCRARLSVNETLAGLKTLNRLDCVLARSEWSDAGSWEGLMRDGDDHVVCGTSSNLFLRRGRLLITPVIAHCGVAGVMRRWVIGRATELGLRVRESHVRWSDVLGAEEVFLTNAVRGIVSVARVFEGRRRHAVEESGTALALRECLEAI